VSTPQAPRHDIVVGQVLESDTKGKPIALFKGQKKDSFAKAYKRDEVWVLVSDETYTGGGLIIFINDKEDVGIVKKAIDAITHKRPTRLKIQKTLPHVAFGEVL